MTSATTERVRKHREQLRAEGLKPVQIWVPDTRSESYRKKCELESLSLKGSRLEAETLAWIAEVSDTDGWVGSEGIWSPWFCRVPMENLGQRS